MDAEDGIDLMNKAFEKRNENKFWEIYLTIYPSMTTKNFVSFEEFYKPAEEERREIEDKTKSEILEDVKEILYSNKF